MLLRSVPEAHVALAAVHGGLDPPTRELVIVRLPPVIWMPPPPRPELASWLFDRVTPLSVSELSSSPPMIPPPPMVPPSRPPVIVSPEKLYWRPTRKPVFRHMTRSPGAAA